MQGAREVKQEAKKSGVMKPLEMVKKDESSKNVGIGRTASLDKKKWQDKEGWFGKMAVFDKDLT